jgi:hypothetical protein
LEIFILVTQANGSSQRLVERLGGDLRVIYDKVKVVSSVKVNDWGPFDYHRDFNLTSMQLIAYFNICEETKLVYFTRH